ncbi:MAG: LVIVD repeat-containing protein, partial [Anaerolineales bacterium]
SLSSIQDSQPDGVVLVVSPANMASLTPEAIIPVGGASLAVQGNRLYVAGGPAGLHIFDISNPLAAVELGGDPSISDARDVAATDRLAFVAGGSQGLVSYNMRNPSDPQRSGGFRTAGMVNLVALSGNYLYASSDRLDIVDISNPSAPELIGSYNRRGAPVVSGEVLYLAAGEDGLAAVDIRDPTAPVELGVLPLSGEARKVAVAGEHAYIASSSGLQVVDISDPQSMTLIGTADGFQATDVAVTDETAFLTSDQSILFFDVSVPETPQKIFEYIIPAIDESGYACGYEPGTPKGVAAEGGRAYVIWEIYEEEPKICIINTGGMLVFGQDTNSQWQLISQAWLGNTLDIEISNGFGYVLTGERDDPFWLSDQLRRTKLWVFDAFNPPYTNPLSAYAFKTWVSPSTDWQIGLAVQHDRVVIGKHEAGIFILQWWPERIFLPAMHTP